MVQSNVHDPIQGDESPVGLMSIDLFGRILETNPALLRFLGSPSKEATARINVLTYLPLVQAGLAADFRRALTEGRVVSSERDYTSKWGKTVRARVTVLPVVDAAGAIVQAQVLVEDRTASHRAEGLLRIQRNLGVALANTSTLSGALDAILDAALSIEGVDSGGVYLLADGAPVLKVHRGFSPSFVERTARYGPDDPQTQLVMAGTPVFRRWPDLLLPADASMDGEGLRATAVIPVAHEGKVVGSLNAASHDEDEIPEPARDALQAISSQIGSIVARLGAEDELRLRERFLDKCELGEIAEREVRRALRFARPLHAVLLQLDQLQIIRSRHGLGAAEEILREAAGRVRANVRAVDLLAIADGDAFCLLLAESNAQESARVAERLRSVVAERPLQAAHGELAFSASAGVSCVSEEADNLSTLLLGAETALAEARAAGGNRTVAYG